MATFKPEACQFIGIGPVSPVPDVEAAVAYYRDQLGFDRDFVEGEPPDHGSVSRGRVGIQFTLPGKPVQPHLYPGWFYLFVDDIDNISASYEQRGLDFSQRLGTRDHGMREFEINDLNGYCLRSGQHL